MYNLTTLSILELLNDEQLLDLQKGIGNKNLWIWCYTWFCDDNAIDIVENTTFISIASNQEEIYEKMLQHEDLLSMILFQAFNDDPEYKYISKLKDLYIEKIKSCLDKNISIKKVKLL